MGSVKLPLEVTKVSWSASSSNAWGTGLTGNFNLYKGNTYIVIANFPTISPSTNAMPVYIYDSSNWIRPMTTNGCAVWILTPTIDLIGTRLSTGFSASVSYSNTGKANLSIIKIA